jgi:hypothetical protein
MIQFWRLGLKRAPVMWVLAGVLYLIAYIERRFLYDMRNF